MTTIRSRKAKGRRLQDWVRDSLRGLFLTLTNDDVKVVVLRGAGAHFSAGHDIGSPGRDIDRSFPRIATQWWEHENIEEEVVKFIDKLINEKNDFIKQRGMEAIGPLMGLVMSKFRGEMDGAKINALLIKKIKEKI